jgi:putative transposase
MDDVETLSHATWDCKYHLLFVPKYRRKALYGQLRKDLGGVFRRLAEQKECRVEEGHLMVDHVQMLVSIPPKYAVSQVVGYLRGSARSTSRGRTWGSDRTTLGSIFGRAGTSCRRWGATRPPSGSTSSDRRRRTSDLTS